MRFCSYSAVISNSQGEGCWGECREMSEMRCQDCGAPCQVATIVCPFCGYEVGLQRVSDKQRLIMCFLVPVLRGLLLLFLLFFAWSGGDFSNLTPWGLVGNISG